MDAMQELSAESREVVELAGRLAQERLAPRAARYDVTATFPFESYEDLRRHGLLRLMVPRAFGGLGADSLTYSLVLLQLSKGCAATGLTFNMHSAILAFLEQLATPEQQARYFREAVEGGRIFASITSEPGSSFRDKFAVGTAIRATDGGYLINGTKHFCSLATGADYFFTWGVLEGAADLRSGLLTILVPQGSPGLTIEETWDNVWTVKNDDVFMDVLFLRPDRTKGWNLTFSESTTNYPGTYVEGAHANHYVSLAPLHGTGKDRFVVVLRPYPVDDPGEELSADVVEDSDEAVTVIVTVGSRRDRVTFHLKNRNVSVNVGA